MIFPNLKTLNTFISEIINLNSNERLKRLEKEKMHISSKQYAYNNITILDISKLLFIQLCGIEVNELEFIRACGSKNLDIKTIGYLGIQFYEKSQKGILLLNTVFQDLQNNLIISKILSFIGNINSNINFSELVLKINKMTEESPLYIQYIISISKNSKKLLFSMYSQNNEILFVKLQIIIDKKYYEQLTNNDLLCLNEHIYFIKSKYIILKLIECYRILVLKKIIRINEKLFEYLNKMIINPTKLCEEYVELALSLEITKLLIEVGYFSEKAEYFIFQLINSENLNLKHLGCKFAMEYNIFSNLVVDRLSKYGSNIIINLNILLKIINETNYKKIYEQKEEIIHNLIKQNSDKIIIENITKKILLEIAIKSEDNFLFMMLIENPSIYKYLRHEILSKKLNSHVLFEKILEINKIEYFLMIYDMFPINFYNEDFIINMAEKHINLILNKPTNEEIVFLVDGLIDVLLTNGNRKKNRELLIKWYCKEIKNKLYPLIINRLQRGILLFNLIMNEKIIELFNGFYIKYLIKENKILLNYSNPIEKVLLYNNKKEIILLEDKFIDENTINVLFSIGDYKKLMLKAFIDDKVIIKSLILSFN